MTSLDGGELLVRSLRLAGVDTFFVLHGVHIDPILQASIDHQIRVVDTRHEAAAGHAAEGYCRSTGRLGVAIVTAGPGFVNLITSITNAYLDCMPVLYIAGGPPQDEAGTNVMQGGFDQVAMAAPVTKWAHRVTHTHRIPDLVATAVRTALSGRPGPVFLEIPFDVMFSKADVDMPSPAAFNQADMSPLPGPKAVEAALGLLMAAERPVIMAGGGAWLSGSGAALTKLAEITGIPVYMNTRGQGLLSGDHPLNAGSFYNLPPLGAAGKGRPDCVLLAGARLGMFTGGTGDGFLPLDVRIIQIDIDAAELGRVRPAEISIAADCRETLEAMASEASRRDWPERGEWRRAAMSVALGHSQVFSDCARATGGPIHPYQAVETIIRLIDPDAILAADGAETFHWLETVARPNRGGGFLAPGYLSCLGVGMPFALGAKVAHPDRQVVCVVGDGAVGMNIQEFDTFMRHDLPITTVILNNQVWGASVHGQEAFYGSNRLIASELGVVNYHEVAAGFGCHGELVEVAEDLEPALRRALGCGKPACVNVMTDRAVVSPRMEAVAAALAARWGLDKS